MKTKMYQVVFPILLCLLGMNLSAIANSPFENSPPPFTCSKDVTVQVKKGDKMADHTVSVSIEYDAENCQTCYTYTVVNDPNGDPDISHVTFGDLACSDCLSEDVATASGSSNIFFGTDPTTSICGIKFDMEGSGVYTICVPGNAPPGSITVAIKASQSENNGFASICGPVSCETCMPKIVAHPDQDLACDPPLNNEGIPEAIPAEGTDIDVIEDCGQEVQLVTELLQDGCLRTLVRHYSIEGFNCNGGATADVSYTWKESRLEFSFPPHVYQEACSDPTTIKMAYENWLTRFKFTGGCNPKETLEESGPPDACGGTAWVTYTVKDECHNYTIRKKFVVKDAPELIAKCAGDVIIDECLNQKKVNELFDNWLDAFTYEGGCQEVTEMGLEGLQAPNACEGGEVFVEYKVTDGCNTDWCSAKFSINFNRDPITLHCPEEDLKIDYCVNDNQLEEIISAYKKEFSFSGGCNAGSRFEIKYDEYESCKGWKN